MERKARTLELPRRALRAAAGSADERPPPAARRAGLKIRRLAALALACAGLISGGCHRSVPAADPVEKARSSSELPAVEVPETPASVPPEAPAATPPSAPANLPPSAPEAKPTPQVPRLRPAADDDLVASPAG